MKKKLLWAAFLSGAMLIGAAAAKGGEFDPSVLARHDRFIGDIISKSEYGNKGSDLNVEICEEGMTLLKNKDNVLPLTDVTKISVFGKSSVNIAFGGGGSGSGSAGSYTSYDLQKSLTEAGFELNPELTSFYKSDSRSGGKRKPGNNNNWDGISHATVGEAPLSKYDDAVMASLDEYHDAAIMVITREGTEGADCKTIDARDHDSDPRNTNHILKLSQNETDLLDMIEDQGFDKIIILINSGNIFQCDRFESDDNVSAVLWMGTPGGAGAKAVGRILNGEVCPSGHTVDTWTRDFSHDPSWENFADNAHTYVEDGIGYPNCTMLNADGSPVKSEGTYRGEPQWEDEAHLVVKSGLNGVKPAQYISYEEGVYVDYRYFETKYADLEAKQKGSGDEWYAGEYGVIWPFGYGLSYTTFKQSIVACDVDENTVLTGAKKRINVTVKVENTGDVTGKDVVQLYWKAPYIDGGIEKPYEMLCAFDKTGDIDPGESQEVKLEFYIQDQANYDCFDANGNGFKGYELDGGEYAISLNKNAHEVYETVKFRVQKNGIRYENDRFTGHKVENRFTDRGFYNTLPGEDGVGFDQFSRHDFEGTFPSHPTPEDRKIAEDSSVNDYFQHAFTLADMEVYKDFAYVPEEAYKSAEDIEALGWSQEPSSLPAGSRIQLSEMIGIPQSDERWTEFMNQMSYKEIQKLLEDGAMHSPGIDAIGKPQTGEGDGPSQFKGASGVFWVGAPIVAATYNVRLAQRQGEMVGTEPHVNGGNWGWWGPAVNIHRSPFGGRNFEYYSADPFLTGRMCAKVVGAATEKGVYCYFKHFAVNDQEKGREGVCAFLTEQAMREIYLRAFQMVFEEGKSMGVMSSYNRIGLMETAASYPLLTEVLRGEWGFQGSVLSDMAHRGSGKGNSGRFVNKYYENINYRVFAGCNSELESSERYTDDLQAKWDADIGAPVYTFTADRDVEYDGESYSAGDEITAVCYSWWYAARMRAQEICWVIANCGVMDKNLVRQVNGCLSVGQEVELHLNEEANMAIAPAEDFAEGGEYNGKAIQGATVSIDNVTPLPEGVSFEEGKLVGAPTKLGESIVHVMLNLDLDDGSSTLIADRIVFKVIDPADKDEEVPVQEDDDDKKDKKEGCGGSCGGSVAAASVTVMALALSAVGLILKKKKEN